MYGHTYWFVLKPDDNLYMHTHIYMYTHECVCLCVCACVCACARFVECVNITHIHVDVNTYRYSCGVYCKVSCACIYIYMCIYPISWENKEHAQGKKKRQYILSKKPRNKNRTQLAIREYPTQLHAGCICSDQHDFEKHNHTSICFAIGNTSVNIP